MDGLRGIIIYKDGVAKAYTSNGIRVRNAKYICDALVSANLKEDWVFDGEFFSSNWNLTNSLVMTQSKHPDAKLLSFKAFDCLEYEGWLAKDYGIHLDMRKQDLQNIIKNKIHKKTPFSAKYLWQYVEHDIIKFSDAEIQRRFKKARTVGFEGCMLKDPYALYAFKRSNAWLKIKGEEDCDVKIVGVKMATKGKYLGLIGSLSCAFKSGKKIITFNSSGMKDSLRKKFTKMYKRAELVGRIVEVRHEGITVNDKVRFPRFRRLREDKE